MSLPPDDLPRSPTGRVPQWVRDEAAGWTSTPTQWRHAGPPSTAPFERSGTRWSRFVAVLVVVVAVGSVTHWLAQARGGSRDLGPDYSNVVLSRSASELPPAVVTNRLNPPPGFEETGTHLGAAPTVTTTSTSYAFQRMQVDGTDGAAPVAWSPCRPIHFVVNPTSAPKDFVHQVVASMGTASVATGLVFVNDGVTDEAPTAERVPYQPARYGDRWAPVLVQFVDDAAIAGLDGDVVGEADVRSAEDPHTGVRYFISGTVSLDTTLLRHRDLAGVPAYLPVLRHELGHLLGLDHIDDRGQLMYPTTGAVVTYQDGDLAGLARLGKGACAPWL